MQFLPVISRAERDDLLVFRYNPKQRSPKTGMHTIHVWVSENRSFCSCGRFHRDDTRLETVKRNELHTVFGLFCKRCTWSDPDAEQRLRSKQDVEG